MRQRWVPVAAAAAVGAVIVTSLLVTRGDDETPSDSDASERGQRETAAVQAPQGWRLVSYRNVVVEVPESWGYSFAPGSDWCADVGGDRFSASTTSRSVAA